MRVRIIVPGEHIDTEVVRKASRAQWGELLEAGAEIYEFQPTMFHCKMLIVDQLMVSVGSTNFDNRSFRLNDEANLNVYDAEFATARQRSLRGRSQARPPHHLRSVAGPAMAGEDAGARLGAAVLPALIPLLACWTAKRALAGVSGRGPREAVQGGGSDRL